MSRILVNLGRTGDIINLLPVLRAESEGLSPPKLMVAEEYAPLLEGVTYVEPVVFGGAASELDRAVAEAKAHGEVVSTQVNGPTDSVRRITYGPAGQSGAVTTSFQMEQWKLAGHLSDWWKKLPLVFDRRDKDREAALVAKWMPHYPRHKYVLLSTAGNSSPFRYSRLLETMVKMKFQKTAVVLNLGEVQADRFYDLLALYERAHCLIATDSAPLQLARAAPTLPVLAITQDQPLLWHGSAWQPNHIWHCRYGDFIERAPEIDGVLSQVVRFHKWLSPSKPRILHLWSQYEGRTEPDDSWESMYDSTQWTCLPIEPGSCGRDSVNSIGDSKRYPFLKDVLHMALNRSNDTDIICLTRPSVKLQPKLTDVLRQGPAFAYRISTDGFSPVGVLFSAAADWWREKLKSIPELVFGPDHQWSNAFWAMFYREQDITSLVSDQ